MKLEKSAKPEQETPIILASQSPRRRELLQQAGIRFQVKVPQKEELPAPKTIKKWAPAKIVRTIAAAKAEACVEELLAEGCEKAIVIAADTLVFLQGKVLGKPKDEADAHRMLKMMSGKSHAVFTGVSLLEIRSGKVARKKLFHIQTKVKFFPLNEAIIRWYISTKEPLDKAGAYGAQGHGSVMIQKFSGSYTNVVGLPLGETVTALKAWE